ncbi:MAG: hypothetical protein HYY61_06280 [Deltaproteobacteria bacterium]|nr:hypothetical protein [Deltaproteobacteria bacterium]
MTRHITLFLILSLVILILLLPDPLSPAFAQEGKNPPSDIEEEQEVDRSIAQEESAYQKDVPMEEEQAPQAAHDMDDSHLIQKSKKSQY